MKSLTAAAVFSAMLLLLLTGEDASAAVLSVMESCVTHVIPSLFPYMVLSSLMISMDLTEPLYRRLPMEKWMGLPRCSASVLLTGLLCGFPVGAVGSAALVRDGLLSRKDAAVLCAASSAASPAFVIGNVGQRWGYEYGTVLWLTQIIFALSSGMFLFRGSGCHTESRIHSASAGFAQSLASAVSSAASACLSVIASVTFFGTAAKLLSCLIPLLKVPASVLLEFSGGAAVGAELGGLSGIIVTGAAVGFTGVSVLIQSAASLAPEKIPLSPLILSKTAAMAVSAAVSALYYLIRHPVCMETAASAPVFTSSDGFAALFFLVLTGILSKFLHSRITGHAHPKKHTEKT